MSRTKFDGAWRPEANPVHLSGLETGAMALGKGPVLDDVQLIQHETAHYIAQMSNELSAMARGSELSLLSYFLDMAAAEAREIATRTQPGIEEPPFGETPQAST